MWPPSQTANICTNRASQFLGLRNKASGGSWWKTANFLYNQALAHVSFLVVMSQSSSDSENTKSAFQLYKQSRNSFECFCVIVISCSVSPRTCRIEVCVADVLRKGTRWLKTCLTCLCRIVKSSGCQVEETRKVNCCMQEHNAPSVRDAHSSETNCLFDSRGVYVLWRADICCHHLCILRDMMSPGSMNWKKHLPRQCMLPKTSCLRSPFDVVFETCLSWQ